jgi:uncharacterized damage-inducible protein DinB
VNTTMEDSMTAIRDHLVRALDWDEAHATFDRAVEGLADQLRGRRPAGFEHSPWQLLEHLRLAQEDILDFCVNPAYEHSKAWPDDYWPRDPAPPDAHAWVNSVGSFRRDREAMMRLAREINLTAAVPTGKQGQTYLRAILLVIDHTAYHVGQLVAVRRALGAW